MRGHILNAVLPARFLHLTTASLLGKSMFVLVTNAQVMQVSDGDWGVGESKELCQTHCTNVGFEREGIWIV